MKNLNEYKISELRKLPIRKWDKKTTYDSLLIINSGKLHDSGYRCMYIIGVRKFKPIEIAACPDDINWDFSAVDDEYGVRTEMLPKYNVMQFWSNRYKFKVCNALSSTKIEVI